MIVAKPHTRNKNLPLGIESSALVKPELREEKGKDGGGEWWWEVRMEEDKGGGDCWRRRTVVGGNGGGCQGWKMRRAEEKMMIETKSEKGGTESVQSESRRCT